MVSRTTNIDPLASATTVGVALLIGAAGFVVGTLFMFIAIGVFSVFGITISSQSALSILISTITLQGLGFGLVALTYLSTRDEGLDFLRLERPGLRDLAWIIGGLLALFGILIVRNIVQMTYGIELADHTIIESGLQNPEILLVLIPLSILLVGPGEELLFRGVIQQLLRLRLGVPTGIAIASAIFSLAHLGSLSGEGLVLTLITYLGLSVILGVSYEYSGTLVMPAMIHGLFNAVQFGVLYQVATTETPAVVASLLII